ncbi:flagella basal body P-ring formation protein FlgA [bacterium]|nr:flagella basal body P-ring formation protein FlgA [bacterium]
MRNKLIIFISVALLLIIGCVVLIVMSLADDQKLKDALSEAGIKVSQEVYTDRPIASGQIITAQDVYENQIPVDQVRTELFLCKDDVIGKRTVGAMEGNQPLTVQDLGLRREDVLKDEIARLKNPGANKNASCSHSADTKVKMPGAVVFKSKRDIPEGERIKASDVEIVPAKDYNTKDAACDIRLVANHVVKYGLENGQLLSSFDFATVGKEGEEDAFIATRDLKPGETVKLEDVAKKHFEKEKCSVNAILDQSLIVGSKVAQPISKDQVFRVIDLQAPTKN